MGRKKRIPSDNFCVVCGRNTNDKKFPSEDWTNKFFVCHNCKKVWCASCMGQVTGLGPSKAHRLGKKGKVSCPDCNQFAAMIKLPQNLPFKQTDSGGTQGAASKFCRFCGESIPTNAKFCQHCGTPQ